MAIPIYRFVSFGPAAGGASGGYYANLYANVKPSTPDVPYCIPNELVCSRLGLFVGLPVPPGGIVRATDGNLWYAAMNFNLKGVQLPPVDIDQCVAQLPQLSARLLIFDIFVLNNDRHNHNFAVDFGENPPRMNVFDFSHALFGTTAGGGANHVKVNRSSLGVLGPPSRHALLDKVPDDMHFLRWIDRIQKIPDYVIEDVMKDAQDVGLTATEADDGGECLRYRRDNLRQIIKAGQAEFKGITQWQLW